MQPSKLRVPGSNPGGVAIDTPLKPASNRAFRRDAARLRRIAVAERNGTEPDVRDLYGTDSPGRSPGILRRTPFIYFMRCNEFVKIGWTTDIATRLRGTQVGNPYPIEVAATIIGDEDNEATLHRAFKGLLHRGEWYRLDSPLSTVLDAIKGLDPVAGRVWVGDWYLANFGKLDLLFNDEGKLPTVEVRRR